MRNLLIAMTAFVLLSLGWFTPAYQSADLIIHGHDHTWVGSYATAMFNLLVRGKKPGLGNVTVDVTYFLCSDTICKRYGATIRHPVYVKKN